MNFQLMGPNQFGNSFQPFSPFGMGGNPMLQMMQMMMSMMMSIMSQAMGGQMGNPMGMGDPTGGMGPMGGMSPGVNPGFGGFPSGGKGPGGFGNSNACGGVPGFNNFGGGNVGSSGAPSSLPNVPPAGSTNSAIANQALGWNGKAFKPGQTKRCADFVSTVLKQAGANVKHTEAAAGLANQGSPVGKDQLKPGDVVLFGNTYRQGKYTHVGIYIGDGKFVHRPTSNKPVRVDRLDQGYYANKFTGARRFETKR